MSPVVTERLVDLGRQIAKAPKGQKTALCKQAATELGVSVQTLYRMRAKVVGMAPRKRRHDAGTSALTQLEAQKISAALQATIRKNGKRLMSVEQMVDTLRANREIDAERVDPKTGEVFELSTSAILRALWVYGYHPDQLKHPDPVTEMASLYPNHVWQIDASICVLYYLKPSSDPRENGLRVMDAKKFYKNKPQNFDRVAAYRVWSYEITDHASGYIYVQYVMGAESGWNLCNVLVGAMQKRRFIKNDLLCGVPKILMMDPGSANTAGMTKNLCLELGIQIIPHAPGAARVTGQVENARNIIERSFESNLSFASVRDLADLNHKAALWSARYNTTQKHRRTGKTRSAVWSMIRDDQLILPPSVEICRELAVAKPDPRTVTPKLRVSFNGAEYDVSRVPGVNVGDKVQITRNPWRDDAAQLIETGEDGQRIVHILPLVKKGDFGFAEDAAIIGESFRAQPETPAQKKRKELAQLAYGAKNEDELKAAKKAKALPFGGRINPWIRIEDQSGPEYMPRRGTPHPINGPEVIIPPLNHIEAAKQLRPLIPDWGIDHMTWMKEKFPDGVPAGEMETIVNHFTRPVATVPTLRVVGE